MLYSFRCKHCGHMIGGANAAECHVPHACPVCHRGVVYERDLASALAHEHVQPHRATLPSEAEMTKPYHLGGRVIPLAFGIKFLAHENWEVLADATPERLAELGLTTADVCRHTPWAKGATAENRAPALIERTASEGVQVVDRVGQ